MTKAQACKILNVNGALSLAKAQETYLSERKIQQRRLKPGNTRIERERAEQKLLRLQEAWNLVSHLPKRQPKQRKSLGRKPVPTRKAQTATCQKYPQSVTEAWDEFLRLSPFSQPVTLAIALLIMILLIVSFSFDSLGV